MTPVVYLDSGHTSRLRSYVPTLAELHSSGHTSQLRSYIVTLIDVMTLVVHSNSGRTSQLCLHIMTLVIYHDSGRNTRLMRIGTLGTALHGLRWPKEGSTMTRTTIWKIPEDHGMLLKA
jgi:hypothetical protein